jgi:hypothetical protein
MACTLARSRALRGAECAVKGEKPQVVAVRTGGERVATCVEDDVFRAVLLEERRRVVCTGTGLEAPQLLAVFGVVCLQATDAAVRAAGDRAMELQRAAPERLVSERVEPEDLAPAR